MQHRGSAAAAGVQRGCSSVRWLLLCLLAPAVTRVAGSRALLQAVGGDVLSNSDGCLGAIPKCEQGACATRNTMGVAKWVCLRCLANYAPVVDGSGQDNIIQCGESAMGLGACRAPSCVCVDGSTRQHALALIAIA
jgi:hypothetical protein